MVNNQTWFDEEYSEEGEKIKSIRIISGGDFQGQLIIKDYPKLEKLFLRSFNCISTVKLRNLEQLRECTIWDCGLTSLVIENCPKIKKLNISNNLLTNLEFLKSLKSLKELELVDISSNNFSESDLKPFRKIINLDNLNIGNPFSRKIFGGIYNRFSGSLRPLKYNNKLRDLDISNTNVKEGLEHLPRSLEKIACSNNFLISWIKENECSEIVRELRNYWVSGNYYSLALWRDSQPFYENQEQSNESITESTQKEINNVNYNIIVGSINNREGHVVIGSLGNNIDLSYNAEQAQIETPFNNK